MSGRKDISVPRVLKHCNYVGLIASQSNPLEGLMQVFEQYLIIRIEEQRP